MRILLLLPLLAIGCGAVVPYQAPLIDPTPAHPRVMTQHAVTNAAWRMALPLERAEMASHIGAVREVVWSGLDDFDPDSEETLVKATLLIYREKRFEDAQAFLERTRELERATPAVLAAHVDGLIGAGRFADARELAFDSLDAALPETPEVLLRAADRSIDQDPWLLPPEVRRLVPDKNIDLIKKLGGGSTVTLKMYWEGEKIGAFKPNQDLGQSMYRSEIAYFRLCQIIRCSFKVPYNEEVKIERGDFDGLYGRVDSPKQRGYAAKFTHLSWTREDGEEMLHGTLKEWIPEFTNFGIERADSWRGFLQQSMSRSKLDKPAHKWIPYLSDALGDRGKRFHKRLIAYTEGLTLVDISRGISDLLVVDFLTNNWDRFSGDPNLYGANCHFVPGRFLALDNGASFPPWDTQRVERRLRYTQRFNRKLIYALRRLEREPTYARLFPNPRSDEEKRFDIFWARRTQLLEYVDGLIDTYGEDAVLSL